MDKINSAPQMNVTVPAQAPEKPKAPVEIVAKKPVEKPAVVAKDPQNVTFADKANLSKDVFQKSAPAAAPAPAAVKH